MIKPIVLVCILATSSEYFLIQARHLLKRADMTDTPVRVSSESQNPNLVVTLSGSRGLDIDLNHSPPSSPLIAKGQNINPTSLPRKPKRKGRKPKYSPEERIRITKERLQRKNRKYTNASINHAKETMGGEQLKGYLQKAQWFRLQKRIRDTKSRDKLNQRFFTGTQTSNDEKGRHLAIERAKKFRERKKQASQ